MTRCDVQASGAVELYFYGELDAVERASVEAHVRGCRECTHALEELQVIRDALALRPAVSAPPSGWADFMTRLESAIHPTDIGRSVVEDDVATGGPRYVAYLAMAALLALVTVSVAVALRSRHAQSMQTNAAAVPTVPLNRETTEAQSAQRQNAEFEALSEEHFERSKLVVLGLATKDPSDRRASDWTYERELASSLLKDTRMYRLAAEDRGLTDIAGVMRDLEIVLLQTSMTDERDPSALPQIQRLIRKRDLLEKMDAVAVPPATHTGTKGI